jgi:hypothetical protein
MRTQDVLPISQPLYRQVDEDPADLPQDEPPLVALELDVHSSQERGSASGGQRSALPTSRVGILHAR